METDLTYGQPAKLIFFFALPLFIGNLCQQLYNVADTLIVGRVLGVQALAAVGSTGALFFLVLGFASGLTSGFSILTAQRFGAKDNLGVWYSFCSALCLSLVAGIILGLLGLFLSKIVLVQMHTPEDIIEEAYIYLYILAFGMPAMLVFELFFNIITALGDSKTPLYFAALACFLNIALDLFFIMVLNLAVAGAALATLVSEIFSAIICIIYIVKKQPLLHPPAKNKIPPLSYFLQSLKLGLPMGFQMSIIAIGVIILQIALNNLGSLAVAAYSAAQKIDAIGVLPLLSFGMAMAAYSGQNFGARKFLRLRQGVVQCCIMSSMVALGIGGILILSANQLMAFFVGSEQSAVIAMGRSYLIYNCGMFWLLAILLILRSALQGIGQTLAPTLAGIFELIMRTLAAIFLINLLGFDGAAISNPLAWFGATIPLFLAWQIAKKQILKANSKREKILKGK